jgi:4-diphosphocytidyl-2-C-methyl-D-erythritol kinase
MQRIYNGLRGFCNQVYAVRILGDSPFIDRESRGEKT